MAKRSAQPLRVMIGVLVALGALYGGSWAVYGHGAAWWSFPSCMTGVVGVISGAAYALAHLGMGE